MTDRPTLGIIACNRISGSDEAQILLNRYIIAAMRDGDCNALIIPSLPDYLAAKEILPRLDGLLLTGSPSNIAPSRYSKPWDQEGSSDAGRDQMSHDLIHAALDLNKSIFGICRGLQEINVALGGSLRRDLGDRDRPIVHHAKSGASLEEKFNHGHPVEISRGGYLQPIFRNQPSWVNSVHFQGVDQLAEGLRVEAIAPDGVIEAFSGGTSQAPIVAVQWHPEWDSTHNAASRSYFQLMGRALRSEL